MARKPNATINNAFDRELTSHELMELKNSGMDSLPVIIDANGVDDFVTVKSYNIFQVNRVMELNTDDLESDFYEDLLN